MKVILCGYNWTGCKAFEILLEQGHEVFVYTHENPPHVPSLIDLCKKRNVPYSLEKITSKNLPFVPDVISSTYYRYIISRQVIEAVNGKIFNLHPSLLPKYRGCSSLTWALINGEKEAGFTFHYIDPGVDTGNVLVQKPITIEAFDTQETLYTRAMYTAMQSYEDVLQKVVNGDSGQVQPTLKNPEEHYYKRGCPHNGEIDDSWDEEYIERFIRAMTYPPLPYASYKGKEVKNMEEYKALK